MADQSISGRDGAQILKQPSVLFVSWTSRTTRPYFDPSTRYRCFHMAEALQRRGFRTQVVAQQVLETDHSIAGHFDRLVFHRPFLRNQIVDLMLKAAERNAVADFDDLIFEIEAAGHTPMVRSRGADIRGVRNSIARMAGANQLFSTITTSTTPLSERASANFASARTFTIHNSLSSAQIGVGRLARREFKGRKRPYRFGYFAGTATHDHDFALIADHVRKALQKSPASRLLLMGPVTMPAALSEVRSQIDIRGIVSFSKLPWHLAQCETVLAPLENNAFNECKSGLKFFEAAVVGCRVLATPIPDIDRFVSPLLVKCQSDLNWATALASEPVSSLDEDDLSEDIAQQVLIDQQAEAFCQVTELA